MKTSISRLAAAVSAGALALLLSGCLVPETVDANIALDGYAYDIEVETRLADPRAIQALAEGHVFTEAEEDRMRAQEERAAVMPGFERFTYVGEGRYDLIVNLEGDLTSGRSVLGVPNTRARGQSDNFLTVKLLEDGIIEVSFPEIPDNARSQLGQLGIVPRGHVSVTTTGNVLEQNADEEPGLFGSAYVWNISSWDDRVLLKVDPMAGYETGSTAPSRTQSRPTLTHASPSTIL
ncbi:hypothetical protein [Pelagibacterium halotolerans]|uniref:hypothetical protein n=1 Tax=Pelagibacterium halotolerans TaxID=531813 RepID=UPI00384BA691